MGSSVFAPSTLWQLHELHGLHEQPRKRPLFQPLTPSCSRAAVVCSRAVGVGSQALSHAVMQSMQSPGGKRMRGSSSILADLAQAETTYIRDVHAINCPFAMASRLASQWRGFPPAQRAQALM